jgi:hypothetical protein
MLIHAYYINGKKRYIVYKFEDMLFLLFDDVVRCFVVRCLMMLFVVLLFVVWRIVMYLILLLYTNFVLCGIKYPITLVHSSVAEQEPLRDAAPSPHDTAEGAEETIFTQPAQGVGLIFTSRGWRVEASKLLKGQSEKL